MRGSIARVMVSLGVAGLAACGGGDGASGGPGDPVPAGAFSCAFVGGGTAEVESGCLSCGRNAVSSADNAIDMDLSTAATINTFREDLANQTTQITVTATAQNGVVFPAGSKPGVAFQLPSGTVAWSVTVNTLLDGLQRESRAVATDSTPNGELAYLGFDTAATMTFDAVQLVLSESAPNLEEHVYRVIEFCGDGSRND